MNFFYFNCNFQPQ